MRRALLTLALLAPGCIFGGTPDPTLELQPLAAGSKVEFQVLSSSVEPGEAYLKMTLINRTGRPLAVDRRNLVLTDGTTQWTPKAPSKPWLVVQPGETSAKLKLVYKGVPGGQPGYDMNFPPGTFREGSDSGPIVNIAPLRFVVKKPG